MDESIDLNTTKYCEKCGEKIFKDAVICPNCGYQVEKLKVENLSKEPQIVINNSNVVKESNNVNGCKVCDKWVAFVLCLFLGFFGVHKFYENRVGLGLLYIFTFGLFGIGWIIDIVIILCKPNPYYV